MGRSAKNFKRPSRAEKVARQTNEPSFARAASPDEAAPSAIPLFNTSRKGGQGSKTGDGGGDDLMAAQEELVLEVNGKKKSLKAKVELARKALQADGDKTKGKLEKGKGATRGKSNVLGGVDYLKLHEKKVGGVKGGMKRQIR